MKSGQVRNSDSARISMPGQLKNTDTDKCVALEVPEKEPEISKTGDNHPSLPVEAAGNFEHILQGRRKLFKIGCTINI